MAVLVEKGESNNGYNFICIVCHLYYDIMPVEKNITLSKIQYCLSHSQYIVENTGLSGSFTYLGRVVLFLSVCMNQLVLSFSSSKNRCCMYVRIVNTCANKANKQTV